MKENHYGHLQYAVQEFCRYAKIPFTGNEEDFKPYEVDLENIPTIIKYLKEEDKTLLEETEWVFEINFEQIKAMFDPVIEKILRLIRGQLNQNEKKCSAIFLVGGFSESKYLQTRIKDEFSEINILVPTHPITSVLRGGKHRFLFHFPISVIYFYQINVFFF